MLLRSRGVRASQQQIALDQGEPAACDQFKDIDVRVRSG
jgi:hypothetical protein